MNEPIVRSEQNLAATLAAIVLGPVFVLAPIGAGIWLMIGLNFEFGPTVLMGVCAVGSIFIAYHMLQNYHWVELQGERIRGQKFWTRQLVDRRIEDIDAIIPMGAVVKNANTVLADAMFGEVRGYEIRFNNGEKIALARFDMSNVEVLIQALLSRMN